jgi:4-hydroxyproline epimerase
MCGHGTIGTITIAIEEGLIKPLTQGVVRLETPAGLVLANYELETGISDRPRVKTVRITNVPSFLDTEGIEVDCPGLGKLFVDVAYGGNFYAIVDVQENFRGIEHYSSADLVGWARALRKNINASHWFEHPLDKAISGCTHVLWTGAPLDKRSTARNAVVYGEKAIDRSPCGTGTSARMAQWYAKGLLKKNDVFIHESIIGSTFVGRIEEELEVNGKPAIRPSVEGWARIYGYNRIWIDKEDDPFAFGFQVI